ncbi:serine hydrolase domain-containing protein [Nocardia sp. NBC_00511]|uniref:serine hydrolase domain-containing protein n=1 Tax=Nocardia sp. NBC_00511 TaxID=2903591 RepID=UPI0030E243B5
MGGIDRFGVRAVLAGLAALVLAAGCAGPKHAAGQEFPADLASTVDRIIRADIDAGLIPGASVAIIDPERGTFSRAYGLADANSGRQASVGDHYRVGSITKTFVATALLRLADAGRLSLDDRLSKYVDGIPNGDTITVRALLGMRAGVYDFSHDPEFVPQVDAAAPDHAWSTEDALRIIRTHPDKAQPPDTVTDYSNSGYLLLGMVLEKVTGRPIRDVIDDLAHDEGLPDTVYPADATLPAPESRGYAYEHDVRTDVTTRTPPSVWGGAGSLVSTVTDLAAYAPLLGEGSGLKPETQRARTTFTTGTVFSAGLEYGLGIMREGSWIGHTGAVLGYTAVVMYLPERKVSIAIASNQYTPLYGSLLSLNSDSLWYNLVAQLYPGTLPGTDKAPPPTPPLPAPTDLNAELREALDPSITAAAKRIRIADTDRDPDLITKLAQAYTKLAITVTVDKTNVVGHGMFATTSTTSPQGNAPMLIPFTPVDGAWLLDHDWSCAQLAAVRETSPACT